jgi:transcriptional regulator with PAS, ATPase and Fis domain
VEDDYRQLNFDPNAGRDGAAARPPGAQGDALFNDCIARIEALKLRLLGHPRLGEYERFELVSELNTLRAGFLGLSAGQGKAGGQASGARVTDKGDRSGLTIEGVVGENPRIRENLDRIARIAPSDLTVLLEGETGSGKELFARIIHLNSRRQNFVPVNCGALPAGVIESELFGHVKGAFTGASTDRKGRFEEADGGTIFLDEVGELEPLAQVKLLRVLDVGEIQRVGSDKVLKVDVRVVAATHRNLEKMVAKGAFREDLFYRLNICHLTIPPLRERRDEVEMLLDFFIGRMSAAGGRPAPALDPALLRFLLDTYHFPGNIRELRNLAQYIVAISNGKPVGLRDLPERYMEAFHKLSEAPAPVTGHAGAHRSTLEKAERDHLVEALTRHRGDVRAMSQDLTLSRARVYQLLKKYGIDPARYRAQ